ncbi:MAG: hypothetical protein KA293_03265 [Bacteroidia bacterium]|nr:hypothetical protein [Bacteroidota bacterium]MBP6639287.1 hypothetical protein [Bacteroidia bacterium]
MKEPLTTQAPKTAENESSQGGLTMAPPKFKLTATSKDSAQADVAAEPAEEFKRSKAANFGVMSFQIVSSKVEAGISPILIALEALKRNPRQAGEFLAYFAASNGKGLFEYLTEKFGQSKADEVKSLIDFGVAVDENALVADFKAAIEDENEGQLMALLMKVDKLDALNTAYKAKYPGEDLLLRLKELGGDMPMLAEMVDDVSGAYQNYETLAVRNSDEATEARQIIARIFDKYHIEINSQEAAYFVKNRFKQTPQVQKDQIKTSPWTLEELQQMEIALERFAPILGTERYESSRSEEHQEVSRIGRVNKDIREDDKGNTYVNAAEGGASFIGSYITAMFDRSEDPMFEKDLTGDSDQRVNGFGAVATHELGHQFFQYALADFRKEMNFWIQAEVHLDTRSILDENGLKHTCIAKNDIGPDHAAFELPPTEYGCEKALEDLAETVMLYFTNKSQLQNGSEEWKLLSKMNPGLLLVGGPCPRRIAFLDKKIAEWKKSEK